MEGLKYGLFSSDKSSNFSPNHVQIVGHIEFHHCCHAVKALIGVNEAPDGVSVGIVKNVKIAKFKFSFSLAFNSGFFVLAKVFVDQREKYDHRDAGVRIRIFENVAFLDWLIDVFLGNFTDGWKWNFVQIGPFFAQ